MLFYEELIIPEIFLRKIHLDPPDKGSFLRCYQRKFAYMIRKFKFFRFLQEFEFRANCIVRQLYIPLLLSKILVCANFDFLKVTPFAVKLKILGKGCSNTHVGAYSTRAQDDY